MPGHRPSLIAAVATGGYKADLNVIDFAKSGARRAV